MQPLHGFHHLTAITADVRKNHAFYTATLGLRLVKKSVNQDDVSAYHLFYSDGHASPGTDITFFDWPLPRERRGTHSIVRTCFRVGSEGSLRWWVAHFERVGVRSSALADRDGRLTMDFEDPEGQRLSLVVDAARPSRPWEKSPIPVAHQVHGLGPILISVPELAPTENVLVKVLGMNPVRRYTMPSASSAGEAPVHVFAMSGEGAASELHVVVEPDLPPAGQGAGGVHHVAFRIPDNAYDEWNDRLRSFGIPSSGPVDRFYFRSLYFREPNGVLFEIATDGPGFTADEPLETLGERLALPPFLERRRKEIEARLQPIV